MSTKVFYCRDCRGTFAIDTEPDFDHMLGCLLIKNTVGIRPVNRDLAKLAGQRLHGDYRTDGCVVVDCRSCDRYVWAQPIKSEDPATAETSATATT